MMQSRIRQRARIDGRAGNGRKDAPAAFAIKDCALVGLATGKKARQLRELRNHLATIESASVYYHFWGGLLQARFEQREYNNDFAAWIHHGIHDGALAERLAALDPSGYPTLELLRRELIELIDVRIDEVEHLSWLPATQPFEFLCSQIVVFDTERALQRPEELATAAGTLSTSSVFYHFIDARRRTPDGRDDFTDWLSAFGDRYAALRGQLADVDPYFGSLGELRDQLADVFRLYFAGAAR